MKKPAPILVTELFPELLNALLDLLTNLDPADWQRPTVAAGWTVHDVALHLLGDDIGNLSRRRDDWRGPSPELASWDELVTWLNQYNGEWVRVTRRISPQLLCDLLRLAGEQMCVYFASVDPFQMGDPVSWAGPDPAPVWLDLAREFTERWHHQQHIRDAVGKPGMKEPRYLGPVLAAFVHALPQTYRDVSAPEGRVATLTIIGPAGGSWSVVREQARWVLYEGAPERMDAELALPEEAAWRVFTKGMSRDKAQARATVHGDRALALRMLDAVSIIA